MSLEVIVTSFIVSFFAGIACIKYIRFREDQIRKKIEEIDSHQEFVEKLSKGNTKLLRSSLTLIFICFFLLFIVIVLLLMVHFLNPPLLLRSVIYGLCLGGLGTGVGVCFYFARAIIQSNDLQSTKAKLHEKRERLERKIT
ncbi:hypothetical protein ACJJIW_18655 [Microbulbifer sp. JMSA004]|uniref:hypothetical protein n=1 Tax=Microbulbifer sp. JMSA004 TaxID=3243370 RepID=UPI00403A2C0A